MATTPICRCRVLYLGSAVPHITKDGLQGIQEPLRDLYPEQGSFSAKGIDSWLSVWSNGILLENVDESMRQVTRFFSIETLHYCAAIRYVVVPGNNGEKVEKFLPLDSPFARYADPSHPPLFACILRRTTGIKVLECHAFICKKEAAANALVRCCFHSYADSMQAKQLEENPYYLENRRSQSMSGLNTIDKVEGWRSKGPGSVIHNGSSTLQKSQINGKPNPPPRNGTVSNQEDDNYKIWTGIAPTEREMLYVDSAGTMRSMKSGNGTLRSAQAKIRQIAGGITRPPPPPSPSLFNGNHKDFINNKVPKTNSKTKSKKKQKKQSGMMVNGHMVNGMRPVSVMGHYGSVPPQMPIRNSGYYTERLAKKNGRMAIPGREEPIYMSNRPLSPVSTYQPGMFPYEQYFMQYGTAPRNMAFREMRSRAPAQMLQQHYYQPQTFHVPNLSEKSGFVMQDNNGIDGSKQHDDDDGFNSGIYGRKGPKNKMPGFVMQDNNGMNGSKQHKDDDDDSPFNTGVYNRKGLKNRQYQSDSFERHSSKNFVGNGSEDNSKHHKNDDDDSPFNTGVYSRKGSSSKNFVGNGSADDIDSKQYKDDDSPFNTGIYKKKGHLNERAFSYSIRQEHRSRSNSLASLQFLNGDSFNKDDKEQSRDEDRRERELAQLVKALKLKQNGCSVSNQNGESNFIKKKALVY